MLSFFLTCTLLALKVSQKPKNMLTTLINLGKQSKQWNKLVYQIFLSCYLLKLLNLVDDYCSRLFENVESLERRLLNVSRPN